MMLEKNSADIAKYIGTWLSQNARPGRGENNNRAMPNPRTIPTFAVDDIARKGFFYAGGEYWGEPGRQVMRGAMYTEVWVPRQVRHPNPIVLFHGNGQTGVDWQQTPDGRAGWAYKLMDEGFVVYMVDYPARGRSAYVPLPGPDGKQPIDGNLGIRTALELERIWTNARERGDFPLKMNHTQWPGTGKMGDPIFDTFIRSQVQFAGATGNLVRPAGIALLEMIGTPVIMFTHSQGGGFGFDITESRPNLVRAMVTAEPGGPQFGGADTAKVEPGPRNPNSWGLTNMKYEYDPPANAPCRASGGAGDEIGSAGRGALLDAGRARAQAHPVAEHPGAGDFRQRHLPPRLRPVHSEVPQSGRREDRLRPPRGRRHQGQQPHDDAREEQRRRHRVRRGVDQGQRAGDSHEYSGRYRSLI